MEEEEEEKNAASTGYRTPNNEWILEKRGQTRQPLSLVKKQKITYYGHVQRSHDLEKVIMQGRMDGSRARGRQRMQFF